MLTQSVAICQNAVWTHRGNGRGRDGQLAQATVSQQREAALIGLHKAQLLEAVPYKQTRIFVLAGGEEKGSKEVKPSDWEAFLHGIRWVIRANFHRDRPLSLCAPPWFPVSHRVRVRLQYTPRKLTTSPFPQIIEGLVSCRLPHQHISLQRSLTAPMDNFSPPPLNGLVRCVGFCPV